jgi:phospho-N-acetylmuramoyl-pentapeptide-transferase
MESKFIILFIAVFLVSLIFLQLYIPFLKRRKFVQFVRDEGVKEHKAKEGTPRGGGLVFFIAPLFLAPFYHNKEFLFLYFALLTFGLIGAIDDLKSILNRESKGLSIRAKLILYTISSVVLFLIGRGLFTTTVQFASLKIDLGTPVYFVLFIVIMLCSANAFNLTDGEDGLLGSVSIPIFIAIMVIASGVVRDLSFIMIASILAFLWFNSPKASVFMGDSGAGALGGLVGAMSILGKFELLLPLIVIIPVMEALSVFIQVGYFKLTHGKRVFKMAPIHHHFELSGWSEPKIDFRFFIITVIFCAVAVLLR